LQDVANNLFFAYNLSNFLTKFEKLWTTWGTFVGFLPLVGPKTYPPWAVLRGFCPWWALKHTHHGQFCGVFARGHTKNMSTMISALLVFQGGAPKLLAHIIMLLRSTTLICSDSALEST